MKQQHLITIAFLFLVFTLPATAGTIVRFVDDTAQGQNTGVDWANAWTDLQSALTTACNNPGDQYEIHVGKGTYKPAVCDPPGECTSESPERIFTFQICSNAYLMGVFPFASQNSGVFRLKGHQGLVMMTVVTG